MSHPGIRKLFWGVAFLGCALGAVAPAVRAAEYWVDAGNPDASDSNPGSEVAPWATIQRGADMALPGDTVRVRGGVYMERVRLSVSGEAGAPIHFVAEPRREVLMHGFTVADASHLRIEGFDISSSPAFTDWDETDGFFLRGSHLEIVDNLIHDLSDTGISGYWHPPFPEDVVVRGNTLYKVQMGIAITGRGWLVEDNEVIRLFQYGGGDCDYSRFFGEDHVIRRNRFHGTDFDEIGEAHVDCFQTFTNNGEIIRNILFDGNVCMDFHQGLMASNVELTDTRDFTFMNNVFAYGHAWGLCVHDVPGIVAVNNTFAHIAYHGAGFRGDSTGNWVANNIFYDMGSSYWGDEGGEVSGDYNLIFEANAPDTPGPHDLIDVDPGFVDPEHDLHLLASSSAVDAGTALAAVTEDCDGTPRPQGAAHDVGAYEHLAGDPLRVVTLMLPQGDRGAAYEAGLEAVGGTPPYTWSLSEGALPPGLSLDAATGTITGSPASAGVHSFFVDVQDTASNNAERRLTIAIRGDEGGDDGCGCRTPVGPPPTLWLAALLWIWLCRRR